MSNEVTKMAWIRSIAAGKTFADVGGLGGSAVNEMVTVALEAGASSGMMVDVLPPDHPFWAAFHAKARDKGITNYDTRWADITAPNFAEVGTFDVVHCSGIIYHMPDPMHMLAQLRSICRDTLVFTSTFVPRRIVGKEGELVLDDGMCLFLPALQKRARSIVADHFNALDLPILGVNMDEPFKWMTDAGGFDFGPWWWLFTEDLLAQMLRVVGFEILKQEETWKSRAVSFLCRRAAPISAR